MGMQSFKQFILSFGKWWWAVVIDYIFGVVGVYQSVAGVTTLSKILWGIVFFLAFTIPPFIAFHKLRIKSDAIQKELDNIKNERPEIIVEPRIESSQAVLIVKNKSILSAEFSAKARLKSFTSTPHLKNTDWLFQLAWESINGVDCRLKGGGDEAKLLVASKVARTVIISDELVKLSKDLKNAGFMKETNSYNGELMFNSLLNQTRVVTHLYGWSDKKTTDTEQPDYSCEIEVSIYANPALPKPFSHIYQLRLKGHGMSFIEKPVQNKVDSQS
jgi:hypothetical protein